MFRFENKDDLLGEINLYQHECNNNVICYSATVPIDINCFAYVNIIYGDGIKTKKKLDAVRKGDKLYCQWKINQSDTYANGNMQAQFEFVGVNQSFLVCSKIVDIYVNESLNGEEGFHRTLTDGTIIDILAFLSDKQDKLIYDGEPTKNSQNSLTSGKVFNALENSYTRIKSEIQNEEYIKKDVNNLENYYSKSECQNSFATKTQVNEHISAKSNPHSVTKSQVGLGNVDNTSDLNKPISTATQTALNGKVDNSTLSDYVKNTDYASALKSGVVQINSAWGVGILTNKQLCVSSATEYEISRKKDNFLPIVSNNFQTALNYHKCSNEIFGAVKTSDGLISNDGEVSVDANYINSLIDAKLPPNGNEVNF